MLFGDKLMQDAWSEFCDVLKTAGDDVLTSSDLAGLDRVEGLRHLTRLVRMQLEWQVEGALDPTRPLFFSPANETKKASFDCPDYVYRMAIVSGSETYRIKGFVGDADLLTFMTYGLAGEGDQTGLVPTGLLETPQIEIGPDGRFEIIVSAKEHEKNWLPMAWNSSQLQFRDVIRDRKYLRRTQLFIENVNPPPLDSLTGRALVHGLESATQGLSRQAKRGAEFTSQRRENAFNCFEANEAVGPGGAYPNQVYVYGYWQLETDEALVIELDLPKCRYWNFHLCNHWAESLDYINAPTNLNIGNASTPDGKLRIVIAHRDPGVANWVDTTGHDHGTMVFRFLHPDHTPRPVTRVVNRSELAQASASVT